MKSFSLFIDNGVEPNSGAILFGLRRGLLDPGAVCDYAEWIISRADEGADRVIDMLIFEGDAEEAALCMECHGYCEDEKSSQVLRYLLLSDIHAEGQDLLEEIEKVWVDFDYPEDMKKLIYYMPSDEGEGSVAALIEKYNSFMASEKKILAL